MKTIIQSEVKMMECQTSQHMKQKNIYKKQIHKHYKTIKIAKGTIEGKIQKNLIHWSSSNNMIPDTQN